jgi:cobalamin biosynthesis protein CobD/CbiB
MKVKWIAIAIVVAVFATVLGWAASGHPEAFAPAFALFALAFILCLAGLVEAVNRCADALEKRN